MTAPLTAYEADLLQRAADWPEHPSWKDLDVDVLRQVAHEHGDDLAVALVYDRLVRSVEHGPFFERVRSSCPQPRPPAATVVLVPGACYVEYPQSGADGQRLRDHAQQQGWSVQTIPIASFGSLQANARTICDWLMQQPDGPVLLVSLSKGGADVKIALQQPGAEAAFRNVRAWISLGGILHGTPLVRCVLDNPLRALLIQLLCWYRRYDFSVFRALDHGPNGVLAGRLVLPPGMLLIHVVGLALACHRRSRRSRRGHARLARWGPNDAGGLLLGQLCRLPGLIYPVWGADHYLGPDWDVLPLVDRILRAAESPDTLLLMQGGEDESSQAAHRIDLPQGAAVPAQGRHLRPDPPLHAAYFADSGSPGPRRAERRGYLPG